MPRRLGFTAAVRQALWEVAAEGRWLQPGETRHRYDESVESAWNSGIVFGVGRGEGALVHLDWFPDTTHPMWDLAERRLRKMGYRSALYRELEHRDWVLWLVGPDVEYDDESR